MSEVQTHVSQNLTLIRAPTGTLLPSSVPTTGPTCDSPIAEPAGMGQETICESVALPIYACRERVNSLLCVLPEYLAVSSSLCYIASKTLITLIVPPHPSVEY